MRNKSMIYCSSDSEATKVKPVLESLWHLVWHCSIFFAMDNNIYVYMYRDTPQNPNLLFNYFLFIAQAIWVFSKIVYLSCTVVLAVRMCFCLNIVLTVAFMFKHFSSLFCNMRYTMFLHRLMWYSLQGQALCCVLCIMLNHGPHA